MQTNWRFSSRIWLIAIVAGLSLDAWCVSDNRSGWGIDFNQFYSASHLAGSGQLYSWDKLRLEESKHGPPVHTARLPVVAYGTKLISWLPYRLAQIIWCMASVASLFATALLWPNANRAAFVVALSWSWPAVLLLILGQDTPFWLLFCAAGFTLLQRNKPGTAGLVLSLCLCKFQLAAGIGLVLIARKQWRALSAAAFSMTLLLSACFLVEGASWPRSYWRVLRDPSLSPAVERMPNLRGMAEWLPEPAFSQAAMTIVVIVLLFAAARKAVDVGSTAAMAAATGLLLAPHCYANDCALALPLIAFWNGGKSGHILLRVSAVLLMTPIPILLLASDHPLWGQLSIIGFIGSTLLTVSRKPLL